MADDPLARLTSLFPGEREAAERTVAEQARAIEALDKASSPRPCAGVQGSAHPTLVERAAP